MTKPHDLIGRVFGRLNVTHRSSNTSDGKTTWHCQCSCGNNCIVVGANLLKGLTSSCGCYRSEQLLKRSFKHGHAKRKNNNPTYKSWCSMLSRCRNRNYHKYKRYGALGVFVCERWLVYENFFEDMGQRPVGTTLDRIDPRGNYEPDNCRWATPIEQAYNQRRHWGDVVEIPQDKE